MNEYYEELISTGECFDWDKPSDLIVEIFGANRITDEKAFASYINSCIVEYLDRFNDYRAYIVIFKVFYRELSTIDHYKKIWRTAFTADIKEQLANKSEMYSEHFNYKLYLGMAEIRNKIDFDYFRILNSYSNMVFIFFSRNEYPLDIVEPVLFAQEKKTSEIDYRKFCEFFCNNGDTVVRFGLDEYGGEIELIHDRRYTPQN